MQRTILFLSEIFGSGHNKAAEALAQSMSLLEPSIHTQIIETGRILHPTATSLFLRSYKKIIMDYPYLWKVIYQSKKNQPVPNWLQFIIYQLFHRNVDQMLEQFKPDLVICTHPFSSSSLSRVKKLGNPVRLCTVITDFHVHRVWVQPEVDLYIVSGDEVRRQLIEMGIPQERIAVTGIPIRMNFWTKNSKQEARKKLNLHHLPTVMIMGGGLGLGGVEEIAFSLVKWKESIQLLICTGSNDSLRLSLLRNKHFQHPHIMIMDFVDRIDKLFDAADLIITKPGGITCIEALTKRVPLLLYQPIPGHEEYNCNHLVNLGLAIKINDRQEIDDWIEKLLFTPEVFEPWLARIEQFQQKMNPLAGAKSVIELLGRSNK